MGGVVVVGCWMDVLLRYVQFSLVYTGPARGVLSPNGAAAFH